MPLRICYLDDDLDLLEIFTDTFSGPDRVIVTFSDVEAAISEIRSNPPDILFIDYRLRDRTGDQIAQMLDPNLPKVLLTGDMRVKCSYAFKAIFEKPYTKKVGEIEALLQNLRRASFPP